MGTRGRRFESSLPDQFCESNLFGSQRQATIREHVQIKFPPTCCACRRLYFFSVSYQALRTLASTQVDKALLTLTDEDFIAVGRGAGYSLEAKLTKHLEKLVKSAEAKGMRQALDELGFPMVFEVWDAVPLPSNRPLGPKTHISGTNFIYVPREDQPIGAGDTLIFIAPAKQWSTDSLTLVDGTKITGLERYLGKKQELVHKERGRLEHLSFWRIFGVPVGFDEEKMTIEGLMGKVPHALIVKVNREGIESLVIAKNARESILENETGDYVEQIRISKEYMAKTSGWDDKIFSDCPTIVNFFKNSDYGVFNVQCGR